MHCHPSLPLPQLRELQNQLPKLSTLPPGSHSTRPQVPKATSRGHTYSLVTAHTWEIPWPPSLGTEASLVQGRISHSPPPFPDPGKARPFVGLARGSGLGVGNISRGGGVTESQGTPLPHTYTHTPSAPVLQPSVSLRASWTVHHRKDTLGQAHKVTSAKTVTTALSETEQQQQGLRTRDINQGPFPEKSSGDIKNKPTKNPNKVGGQRGLSRHRSRPTGPELQGCVSQPAL